MRYLDRCYIYWMDKLHRPKIQSVIKVFMVGILLGLCTHVYAEDLLKGTESNLTDTLNGTGKKYLYLSEGLVSLLIYIKTKNIIALIGILIVAIFFNLMLKMAGV